MLLLCSQQRRADAQSSISGSSHRLQNTTRFQSRSSRRSSFCVNTHGLRRGLPGHGERGSEGAEEEEKSSRVGGRMVWDAEACVLTVRCCSSGLVRSSYRSTGRRWDVGVTAMERVHTHTHGQGDTETSACETMRTWKSTTAKWKNPL